MVAAMAKVTAAAAAAGGLIGGYGVARWTGKRPLGGIALAAAGSLAAYEWNRQAGPRAAAGLTVAYVAAFAGSHPLAKKIGAWPAVFTVAGGVAAVSWAVTRRTAGP
jgi:predicted membrane-bound dolichyl-phosphate-mannose-protein mannosyltransferase